MATLNDLERVTAQTNLLSVNPRTLVDFEKSVNQNPYYGWLKTSADPRNRSTLMGASFRIRGLNRLRDPEKEHQNTGEPIPGAQPRGISFQGVGHFDHWTSRSIFGEGTRHEDSWYVYYGKSVEANRTLNRTAADCPEYDSEFDNINWSTHTSANPLRNLPGSALNRGQALLHAVYPPWVESHHNHTFTTPFQPLDKWQAAVTLATNTRPVDDQTLLRNRDRCICAK